MNDNATNDGRIDRRTYLKLAGAGALTAGIAGCVGKYDGVPASFDCSQFLETHPYSRDEPSFSFQFVVPKNWEADLTITENELRVINLVAPATRDIEGEYFAHSMEIYETKLNSKIFANYFTHRRYEKLGPRPYGSGEIIPFYKYDKSIGKYTKSVWYRWGFRLPTDTDEQIHIAKITGIADILLARDEKKPFCEKAIKKTTEKTVNSIRPK